MPTATTMIVAAASMTARSANPDNTVDESAVLAESGAARTQGSRSPTNPRTLTLGATVSGSHHHADPDESLVRLVMTVQQDSEAAKAPQVGVKEDENRDTARMVAAAVAAGTTSRVGAAVQDAEVAGPLTSALDLLEAQAKSDGSHAEVETNGRRGSGQARRDSRGRAECRARRDSGVRSQVTTAAI